MAEAIAFGDIKLSRQKVNVGESITVSVAVIFHVDADEQIVKRLPARLGGEKGAIRNV